MDSAWKYPNSQLAKDTQITMLKVITDNWKHGVCSVCGSKKKNLVYLVLPGGGSKTKVNRIQSATLIYQLPDGWNAMIAFLQHTIIRLLTLMPKSGDVELQIAPILAAASIASTAWMLFGK